MAAKKGKAKKRMARYWKAAHIITAQLIAERMNNDDANAEDMHEIVKYMQEIVDSGSPLARWAIEKNPRLDYITDEVKRLCGVHIGVGQDY